MKGPDAQFMGGGESYDIQNKVNSSEIIIGLEDKISNFKNDVYNSEVLLDSISEIIKEINKSWLQIPNYKVVAKQQVIEQASKVYSILEEYVLENLEDVGMEALNTMVICLEQAITNNDYLISIEFRNIQGTVEKIDNIEKNNKFDLNKYIAVMLHELDHEMTLGSPILEPIFIKEHGDSFNELNYAYMDRYNFYDRVFSLDPNESANGLM